jgi:hypothetical protein
MSSGTMKSDDPPATPIGGETYRGIMETLRVLEAMEEPHRDYQSKLSKVETALDGGETKFSLTTATIAIKNCAHDILSQEVKKRMEGDHAGEYRGVQDAVDALNEADMVYLHNESLYLDPRSANSSSNILEKQKEYARGFLANSCLSGTPDSKRTQIKLLQELTSIRYGVHKACSLVATRATAALSSFLDSEQGPDDAARLGDELSSIIDDHISSKALINTSNRRELEIYCLGEDFDKTFSTLANQALDDLIAENPDVDLEQAVSECEWTLNHAWKMIDDAEFSRVANSKDLRPAMRRASNYSYEARALREAFRDSRGPFPFEDAATLTDSVFLKDSNFREKLLKIAERSGESLKREAIPTDRANQGQSEDTPNYRTTLTIEDGRSLADIAYVGFGDQQRLRGWQATREKATLLVHQIAKALVTEETFESVVRLEEDLGITLNHGHESDAGFLKHLKPADELWESTQAAKAEFDKRRRPNSEDKPGNMEAPAPTPVVKRNAVSRAFGRIFE